MNACQRARVIGALRQEVTLHDQAQGYYFTLIHNSEHVGLFMSSPPLTLLDLEKCIMEFSGESAAQQLLQCASAPRKQMRSRPQNLIFTSCLDWNERVTGIAMAGIFLGMLGQGIQHGHTKGKTA